MSADELDECMGMLPPRGCRGCGAWTGSVALEWCEGCERARRAAAALHALAVEAHARGVAEVYDAEAPALAGD
jgi:hypothetical protein